MSELLEAEK